MPCPFRFLELPKELRLMVYERVPRTIHHRTIQLCRPDENDKPHTVLTLIIRSIPMSLLAVSRQVYLEANPILHGIADNFILNSVPRFIYENEELFNPDLIEWLLICIAGQTQVHSELHKGSASRDLSQVDFHPSTTIRTSYYEHAFRGRSWRGPIPINTILERSNMLTHTLRFIAQAGRQLTSLSSTTESSYPLLFPTANPHNYPSNKKRIELVLSLWHSSPCSPPNSSNSYSSSSRYPVHDGYFTTEMLDLQEQAENAFGEGADNEDKDMQLVIVGYREEIGVGKLGGDGHKEVVPVAIGGEKYEEEDILTFETQMSGEWWREEWGG